MNKEKHEWYGLSPADREALVLELLDQGYTADQLNDYFAVKTKRVINDFMNSRGYSKKDNIYVPKSQKESTVVSAAINKKPQQQNNLMSNIDEETIMNMLTVSKQADKIQEIINWYEDIKDMHLVAATTEPEEHYIEVIDTSLPIPKVEGEIKRTTIRVNENLMNTFNEIWKRKFPEYRQHNLLNLALQMFIDKYK